MRTMLFLSPEMPEKSGGGAFTQTLLSVLRGFTDVRFLERRVPLKVGTVQKLKSIFQGYAKGMTRETADGVLEIVRKERVDVLFANFTYFGKLIERVKREFPDLRVVSMAHDVEVVLCWHEVLLEGWRGWKKLIGLPSVYVNERKQVALSDQLICLNERDGEGFAKWYGRKPDAYLPLIIRDACDVNLSRETVSAPVDEPFALFVGSHFPPNVYAMRWWAANVAPHVKTKLKVVGFGFESLRDELEQTPNMEVVGAVEDLSDFYRKALFVVSPIFHGSGMKTKTAEALMHGKYLLASDEALTGYEMPFPECGRRCNTADEFIAAVRELELCPVPRFVEHSRNVYLEKYSPHVMKAILGKVLAT